VTHFVASKRSLQTQTILWRANEIVTSARALLEENAVLAAKNASIRNIVDEQVDALEAVRRGIDVVEADVQAEFKVHPALFGQDERTDQPATAT
jgi:autophagy-related protein 17